MTNATEITLTLPVSAAVQNHIEGLQAKLTERNKTIEALQARAERAEAGEPNQVALARSYERGFKDAANKMMALAFDAAQALGKLRAGAWETYLENERAETARIRAERTEGATP